MSKLFKDAVKKDLVKEKISDRCVPITQLKQAIRDVNSLIAKENLTTSMARRFASLEIKGDALIAGIDSANQAVIGVLARISNDIFSDPDFTDDQTGISDIEEEWVLASETIRATLVEKTS